MNINAYDITEPTFEKGTWVDPKLRRLYSTEIKYTQKCIFLNQYDKGSNTYTHLIGMVKTDFPNAVKRAVMKNGNIVKIYLDPIWNETSLINLTSITFISIELIEEDDNIAIYKLDI